MKRFHLASLVAVSLLSWSIHARASQPNWIPPRPDELAMTEEPKAPGAPAILLYYSEESDAATAEITMHARIKILTASGIDAGTIQLPVRFTDDDPRNENVVARTIHSDGTIIPFDGKPHHGRPADNTDPSKTFISMPDVQVGSILEYICHFRGRDNVYNWLSFSPVWQVQHSLFTRNVHFSVKFFGKSLQETAQWVANLPPGVTPIRDKSLLYLDAQDIPAGTVEPFMPPFSSVTYQVRFYYHKGDPKEYWSNTGGDVSANWTAWEKAGPVLQSAVKGLIQPGDSDEQKLHRLYTAVNSLQNTDTTRWHSKKEDKANGVIHNIETIDDVWLAKRGSSSLLTLLFIAMARAAGFEAYPIAVASRDEASFDERVLDWNQFDSLIAVVGHEGKAFVLDPGVPMCPYLMLAPWHAESSGFSASGAKMSLMKTPAMTSSLSRRERFAGLKLDADGNVSGTVRIAWIGGEAIPLRLLSLSSDNVAISLALEKSLEDALPSGFQVKLTNLEGIDSPEKPLIASFAVSGKLGTVTPKRILLPAQFFESHGGSVFVAESRTYPVSFPLAHRDHDRVDLRLPPGVHIESLPENQTLQLDERAGYYTQLQIGKIAGGKEGEDAALVLQRTSALNKLDYPVSDYPALRRYFGYVAASDQEQIILARSTPANPSTR